MPEPVGCPGPQSVYPHLCMSHTLKMLMVLLESEPQTYIEHMYRKTGSDPEQILSPGLLMAVTQGKRRSKGQEIAFRSIRVHFILPLIVPANPVEEQSPAGSKFKVVYLLTCQ